MRSAKKKSKEMRGLTWGMAFLLYLLYLAMLLYFLFFSELLGRDASMREYSVNLIPMKEIRRFYEYRESLGMAAFLLNTVGNVIAFIPFGFFMPFLEKGRSGFLGTAACCMLFSFAAETMQFFFCVGSFDIDDIILNTIGGMAGFIIYVVCHAFMKK